MKIGEVAVCMLIAAVIGPWLPGPSAAWFLIWLPGILLGGRLHRRIPLLCLCFLVCGVRSFPFPGDARLILEPHPQTVRVRFTVQGDARKVERLGGRVDFRQPVRLTGIERQGEWRCLHGRAQVRWTDPSFPPPRVGSYQEVTGVLTPADVSHVGLRRASWQLEIPSAKDLQGSGFRPAGPGGWMFALRDRVAGRILDLSPDHPSERSVMLALMLGMRTEVDDTQMKAFATSGLIHIFAVSGLHLGLLATLLQFWGRRAGFGIRFQLFWILPVLFLFSWMTGMRASAVRALLMMTFFYAAPLVYRRSDALNALAFAVVVILGIAPEQVLDPGFQFSIVLVGGLLLIWPEVDAWLRSRFARDPWAPVAPVSSWCEHRLLHPVLRALGVSFVCVLVSTPLTAYYFSLVSPVGVLGNLLAVPLVFLLLASGFAVVPLLLLPDPLAGACLQVPLRVAGVLLDWVDLLRRVPFGVHMVRSPATWVLLALGVIVMGWVRKGTARRLAVYAALTLAGGLATDAFVHHRSVHLVVLDAGRGQAGWLRNARGEVVVIDTGSAWSGWKVAESLKEEGIDRIAAVILTHPDPRHIQGLAYLQAEWSPEQILIAAADRDHPHYQALAPTAGLLKAGEVVEHGGWTLEVLHPPEQDASGRADDRSLVLRLVAGSSSVLWMGGASESVEQRLLAAGQVPPATVVVAGHHRNLPGMMLEFLSQVQPRLVIVSGQGFGGILESRRETEKRVRSMGLALESPDSMGQVRVQLPSGGLLP